MIAPCDCGTVARQKPGAVGRFAAPFGGLADPTGLPLRIRGGSLQKRLKQSAKEFSKCHQSHVFKSPSLREFPKLRNDFSRTLQSD